MNMPDEKKFHDVLTTSAAFRLFSLCFQHPRPGRQRELEELCREVGGPANQLLALSPDKENDYHFILGAGGVCSPCESEYVGDRLGGKGPLMADVAGFYRAFSFDHRVEINESVDHIAVELSFLSYLNFKKAYALFRGNPDELRRCDDALDKFREQHLLLWIGPFNERLHASAPDSFYARASALMCEYFSRATS